LVHEYVKSQVRNEEITEEVFNEVISLLEDKYGILFDVDKKVEI